MKRVEFRLSMPGVASWDGRWSGAAKNFAIVKSLTDRRVRELLEGNAEVAWVYNFGDGWCAEVTARVVEKGERLRRSDGFCGYGWMVDSILADGEIYGPMRPKPEVAS